MIRSDRYIRRYREQPWLRISQSTAIKLLSKNHRSCIKESLAFIKKQNRKKQKQPLITMKYIFKTVVIYLGLHVTAAQSSTPKLLHPVVAQSSMVQEACPASEVNDREFAQVG